MPTSAGASPGGVAGFRFGAFVRSPTVAPSGHGGLVWFHGHAPDSTQHSITDEDAHVVITCGHCGREVCAAVLVKDPDDRVAWLRCPACGRGSVEHETRGVEPGCPPGADLRGLPLDVTLAYPETRAAASAGAWTATEMMCRKILMHVAVDKGAPTGRNFVAYLDYLVAEGWVPAPMWSWVDLIRRHGNEAAHELNHVTSERGHSTFLFTEQLLRSTYEMAALAAKFIEPNGQVPPV